jgi:hypothetical protein
MNPNNSPLLTAEDSIEVFNELYLQSVKALEQADRIAEDTDNLRAIATAAQLRKELRELVSDRQAWISKKWLIEEGVWGNMMSRDDLISFHIDIISGNQTK